MNRKAILCVDDEAILLLALKQELRGHFGAAYLYESALSPPEAFSIIEELEAAGTELVLVLSDWLMPGMRGDAFLGVIRERHPAARLVLLTGMADEGSLERAIAAARLDACVMKPWSSAKLLGTLDALLKEDQAT